MSIVLISDFFMTPTAVALAAVSRYIHQKGNSTGLQEPTSCIGRYTERPSETLVFINSYLSRPHALDAFGLPVRNDIVPENWDGN